MYNFTWSVDHLVDERRLESKSARIKASILQSVSFVSSSPHRAHLSLQVKTTER